MHRVRHIPHLIPEVLRCKTTLRLAPWVDRDFREWEHPANLPQQLDARARPVFRELWRVDHSPAAQSRCFPSVLDRHTRRLALRIFLCGARKLPSTGGEGEPE